MAIVVYTAIFGDIGDKLQPLPEAVRKHKCIAYTDTCNEPAETNLGWELRPSFWPNSGLAPRKLSRKHKLLAHILHPDAQLTLWVDGCLTPQTDPIRLSAEYLKQADLCVFSHTERECVYQEASACIQLQKDSPETIRKVIARYRGERYPNKNGLAETGVLLRRHSPATSSFNEQWWAELDSGSVRDQLSFDYVRWKRKFPVNHFEGQIRKSPLFLFRPHR